MQDTLIQVTLKAQCMTTREELVKEALVPAVPRIDESVLDVESTVFFTVTNVWTAIHKGNVSITVTLTPLGMNENLVTEPEEKLEMDEALIKHGWWQDSRSPKLTSSERRWAKRRSK